MGIDISRDNIENKIDGACARYLNQSKKYKDLPREACDYLNRISELVDVPVDIISTGPERNETIILKNRFV